MKRMICTALTALFLVGAPIATFAQTGGTAPAQAAPKMEKKQKKAKKTHHKKMKASKGKTKQKAAEPGSDKK